MQLLVEELALESYILAHSEETTNGCLVWTGPITPDGYGRISIHGKTKLVHRVWYELKTRCTISPDKEMDHLCRNRPCFRLEHLEEVTSRENLRRGLIPKVTETQIGEIRAMFAAGVSQRPIAKRFGISQGDVSRIINGRIWEDLELGKKPENPHKGVVPTITQEQAQEIRALLEAGELQRVIAAKYGIHRVSVSRIKTGKHWKVNP